MKEQEVEQRLATIQRQIDLLNQADVLNQDGRPESIDAAMASVLGIDVSDIQMLSTMNDQQRELRNLSELQAHLIKRPTGGTLDPTLLRLQEEMKDAAASEDYVRAAGLKVELEQMMEEQQIDSGGWARWTRVESIADIR